MHSPIASLVQSALASLSEVEEGGWEEEAIGSATEHIAWQCGVSKGKVLAVLRAVLTGNKVQRTVGQLVSVHALSSLLSLCSRAPRWPAWQQSWARRERCSGCRGRCTEPTLSCVVA